MSGLLRKRPAWFGGRAGVQPVRFSEAVPVRKDRRDLRRQFRRAARAATVERKAQVTTLLWHLVTNRVPLYAVRPGSQDAQRVIEFSDGTRLLLTARSGSAGLGCLAPGPAWSPVWLVQARPSFARNRFRLWFASSSLARPLEILAAVTPTTSEALPR